MVNFGIRNNLLKKKRTMGKMEQIYYPRFATNQESFALSMGNHMGNFFLHSYLGAILTLSEHCIKAPHLVSAAGNELSMGGCAGEFGSLRGDVSHPIAPHLTSPHLISKKKKNYSPFLGLALAGTVTHCCPN